MRPRHLWIALGVGLGAATLLTIEPFDDQTAEAQSTPPDDGASDGDTTETGDATSTRTGEVRRETLQSSDEFNADLGFGETRSLQSGSDGTITWLPVDDQVIVPGDIIWEINQQPVPYLEGSIPMYRELFWGATKGDDIEQLEGWLINAGYGPDGWQADTSFNATTRRAVKDMQTDFGMTSDGVLSPSELRFGTTPLRVADTAFVGDRASEGPILTVTEATAEVTVQASSRQLTTFQNAPTVTIVLADGSELSATLDDTKATPADENGRFGYTVTYVVDDPISESQPVKIRVEKVLADDALTVPVDALIALAEGGYAVELVTDGGNVLRGVEVIDFDDTRVAVTGDLEAGDRVVVP